MSERGSFCTEYIYCDKCLAAVQSVLMADPPSKSMSCCRVPSWVATKELPIIAGKIGGTAPGDEIAFFKHEYGPAIARRICHRVIVAVLAENGAAFAVLDPDHVRMVEADKDLLDGKVPA